MPRRYSGSTLSIDPFSGRTDLPLFGEAITHGEEDDDPQADDPGGAEGTDFGDDLGDLEGDPDEAPDDESGAGDEPFEPTGAREVGPGERFRAFLPGVNDFSVEDIRDLFAGLAAGTIPERQQQLDTALAETNMLAAGSPMAIIDKIRVQAEQIGESLNNQFAAVSRRLGPQGGGQVRRDNAQSLAQAGASLQGLFTQAQSRGTSDLFGVLRGFRPVQAQQLPVPQEQTTPFDPTQLGTALAGAVAAGRSLFNRQPATTFNSNPVAAPYSPVAPAYVQPVGGSGAFFP